MAARIARYLVTIVVLAAGYFVAARVGLTFAIPPGNASVVWPASGIALAVVLLMGYRVWPGVWLGAAVSNATTTVSLATAVTMATGNTLEALLGAWLFRRLIVVEAPFKRVEEAFLLAVVAAAASALAAAVGAGSLVLGGDISSSQFAANAGTWWLGDVAGLMIALPLVLAFVPPRRSPLVGRQRAELVALFVLMVLASQCIFGGWLSERLAEHLLYVPLLFLVWVCLRFELTEVTVATALLSGFAIWGAWRGFGPYGAEFAQRSLFDLQMFMNVYALTGLALAAVVASRRAARERLEENAAESLREREARYRELIKHLQVGVVAHGPDTSIEVCNRRAAELLGVSDGDMLGKTDDDPAWFFLREDGTRLPVEEYPVNRVLATRQPLADLVCGIHRPDTGGRVWVLVTAFPEFGEDRELRRVVVTFSDITGRKRIQEVELTRLATALESIGEGIVITDPQGTIQYVNPAFERITGYLRPEVVGKNPRILQSGQHDQAFYRTMWSTIEAGHVWRGSFVYKRKDGQLYDVETTITPITESGGNNVGYTAVTRDVTDRKRAERALRESEARIRAIVETAVDGIITIDERGVIETCNPAIERIFGYSREQMIGRNVSLLMPSPYREEHDGYLAKYLRTGQARVIGSSQELIGQRQDGSTFPMDLAVNETRLGDRRFFTGIVRDVTLRHLRLQTERDLAATREQMRVAQSIQQSFFPVAPPDLPGFDISGASYPADATGGDYFDYLPMSEGRVGIVLGDVSGHGLGPALVMSQTRAYLHALLPLGLDVSELVTRLNDFLIKDVPEGRFVTLFLAQLDPRDQSLVYVSAGHPCYLIGLGDKVERLEATGIPLGILPRPIPSAAPRILRPGELVLFLTDGVPETHSPDEAQFGVERTLEIVRANRDKPARDIVETLYRAVRSFAHDTPQEDDITVVVAKVEGLPRTGGSEGPA